MDDDLTPRERRAAFALVTLQIRICRGWPERCCSPVLRAAGMLRGAHGSFGIDLTQAAFTLIYQRSLQLAAQVAGYEGPSADEAAEAFACCSVRRLAASEELGSC